MPLVAARNLKTFPMLRLVENSESNGIAKCRCLPVNMILFYQNIKLTEYCRCVNSCKKICS